MPLSSEEFFIILLVASPVLAVLAYGLFKYMVQRHRIHTFQPIQVTILSKRLGGGYNVSQWERYPHYPVVEYSYDVEGQTYTSKQVTPYPKTTFYGQTGLFLAFDEYTGAQRVLDQFEEGKTYEGFYNPKNPKESFLLKKYDNTVRDMTTFSILYIVIIFIVKLLFTT